MNDLKKMQSEKIVMLSSEIEKLNKELQSRNLIINQNKEEMEKQC